jgi:hypothetical protein
MADIDLFKTFELYLNERTRLTSSKQEASKSYDQTILTFSAGAVALSITFLEKLAPTPTAKPFLYTSWIFFALAIFSTLYSLLASQRAIEEAIGDLETRYQRLLGISDEEKAAATPQPPLTAFGVTMKWLAAFEVLFAKKFAWFGELVKWLNRFAGAFFFVAVLLFGWFALENWVNNEDQMAKDKDLKIITGDHKDHVPDGMGRVRGGMTPEPGVLPPVENRIPSPPPPPPSKEKK